MIELSYLPGHSPGLNQEEWLYTNLMNSIPKNPYVPK